MSPLSPATAFAEEQRAAAGPAGCTHLLRVSCEKPKVQRAWVRAKKVTVSLLLSPFAASDQLKKQASGTPRTWRTKPLGM